jgi:purine-binding chemotaxis protein CheW
MDADLQHEEARGLANRLPHVIFQVKGRLYAVASGNVREIVILPQVTFIPTTRQEIRGVINLRGKIIPLIDLRLKLGLPSAKSDLDDLIQLLRDREQDHQNWLAELEACVRERHQFKMTKDPHACKFGLWFDHFKTDNGLLNMSLKKMDKPHQAIHAVADEVLRQAEAGKVEGTLKILADRRKGELAELMENHRELAVVLVRKEKRFAVSIDLVEAVERILEENIEPMPAAMAGRSENQHWRVGKRAKTDQTILLIDEEFLFLAEAMTSIPSAPRLLADDDDTATALAAESTAHCASANNKDLPTPLHRYPLTSKQTKNT